MAEYIDRERLKQCFHANICGGNVYDELIDMQPTADVIERSEYDKVVKNIDFLSQLNGKNLDVIFELRSKIDKAVEEITQYGAIEKEIGNKEVANAILDVLEILKRNIGE